MPVSYAVEVNTHSPILYEVQMSRRKNRRLRRAQERLKKKEKLKQYDNFENVISFESLFKSAENASKGVAWKASVQRYILGILFRTTLTRKNLQLNKDVRQGFIEFDINERGKTRHIKSVHFNERVVQKSLCKYAMYPMLTNSIIYDNCASQKGKGTLFAQQRLEKHLRKFYKQFGRNGYILLIDFKNYFESIPHNIVKERLRKSFTNPKLIKLADDFIDAFGDRGLGLGSETSQINAIAHINGIDHYIKEIERIKYYGRYMDDSYIIHHDKQFLLELLEKLDKLYTEYGVTLNRKKTKIISLKHSFTYLKTRFFITETGKLIRKPCRKSITQERRKIKRQAKLVQKGLMSEQDACNSLKSWTGSMKYKNAKLTTCNMILLYRKLIERSCNYDRRIESVRNDRRRNPIKNIGVSNAASTDGLYSP